MPPPRSRLAGLLLGALLVAGVLWWALASRRAPAAALPPVMVDVTLLDIIEAFDRGGPELAILAQDAQAPLLCLPAQFEKDAQLASDQSHKLIRAHAESAFEVRVGALQPGARLIARTMVYSAFRTDPERVDPAPVDFRILVNGVVRARLSSDYVRQTDVENPYDQVLRTLQVPLDGTPAGGSVTLRFETTRSGRPVPPGAAPAEPLWWELRVEQPFPVPRQTASPARPNVLVLMVDTLAARRMSLHGYGRPTTPELISFARGGTLFENATAPASWTLPSVATQFTGLPPNTHGVLGDTRSYLMDGLTTWPEVLRQAGLPGLAVVANPLICAASNFQQGFETWQQANQESAEQLNARLLGWIDGQPAGGRWFAYVHYMDPHAPYAAPGPARERFTDGYVEQRPFGGLLPGLLQHGQIPDFSPAGRQHVIDLYDAEVGYWDACFGRLREALAERGLLDRTILALIADHGEELFEHGRLGHGYALYEEQLHVPLLLVGPGVPAGRSTARTGTAGLANTLLRLAGGAPLAGGADALLPRPPAPAAPVLASVRTQLFGPRASLVSAVDGEGRKVILRLDEQGGLSSVERFDLRADPSEAAPLQPAALDAAALAAFEALQQQAQEWFADSAARRPPGERPQSPEIVEALRQNGYLGTTETGDGR